MSLRWARVLALSVGIVSGVPIAAGATANAAGPALAAGTAHAARIPAAPSQPGQGWLTGRRQRLLAVWLLVDVGILLGLYATGPVRRPRLLGSLGARAGAPRSLTPAHAEPERRGIGRFAKSRIRPPPRL